MYHNVCIKFFLTKQNTRQSIITFNFTQLNSFENKNDIFVKLKLIYIYIRTVEVFYANNFLICISLVKIDKVFHNEMHTDLPSKLNLMLTRVTASDGDNHHHHP